MKKAELKIGSNKMIILEKSEIHMFDFNDIIGVFSDHPYLLIEFANKTSKLIFYSLKEIGQLLPIPFIKCNRSSIINITYLTKVTNENSESFLQLKNGKKINLPRRKKNDIISRIKSIISASFAI